MIASQPAVGAIEVLPAPHTSGWHLVRNESAGRTCMKHDAAGDKLALALPSGAPNLTLRAEFLTSYEHFGAKVPAQAACARCAPSAAAAARARRAPSRPS